MNEIKSYEITLSLDQRIHLYITGAISWSELFSSNTFRLQADEIQWLFNFKLRHDKFVCYFERDSRIHSLNLDNQVYSAILKENSTLVRDTLPLKLFKYNLPTAIFFVFAFTVVALILLMLPPATIFQSNTCSNECVQLMGTYYFLVSGAILYMFGSPLIYFLARHFFTGYFKLKPGRPFFETMIFAMIISVEAPAVYKFCTRPQTVAIINHWKNGTLNHEVIADLKSQMKTEREQVAEKPESEQE